MGHNGCVNSALFSWNGENIFTGSSDLFIQIFKSNAQHLRAVYHPDTSRTAERYPTEGQKLRSKHTNNIFYVKDLPGNKNKIVSCGADGRVMLIMALDDGRHEHHQLARHSGRAHRLALSQYLPNQIYSCGEDGKINFIDIRVAHVNDLAENDLYTNFPKLASDGHLPDRSCASGVLSTTFRNPLQNFALASAYCISSNPQKEFEVACSGESNCVSVRHRSRPGGHY